MAVGKKISFWVAVSGIYGLMGVSAYGPGDGLWGVNHFRFLPDWSVAFYVLGGAVLAFIAFGQSAAAHRTACEHLAEWLWEGPLWRRVVLSIAAAVLFWFLRTDTHLLGDGYTILAIFSRGEAYIHKWAEPGSIWLVRQVQWALGGYDRATALIAFQLLSVTSGAIFVYNTVAVVGQLVGSKLLRVIGMCLILFSGWTLLFMGYVEFYPMLWAAISVFFNLSLRTLQGASKVWLPIIAYLFAVSMHLQAIYFAPAVLFLAVLSMPNGGLRKIGFWFSGSLMLAGGAVFVWLYNHNMAFEILILPLLQARPVAPGYTVLSPLHLFDLLNELLLVAPAFVPLLFVVDWRKPRSRWDAVGWFLLISSLAGLLFLVLFGAAITMARDWDIMALSLLAPVLLSIHLLDSGDSAAHHRELRAAAVLSLVCAVSFIAINSSQTSSESRFATLLNDRNRNGWVLLANYFLLNGDAERHSQFLSEASRRFPDYNRLQSAYDDLDRGNVLLAARKAEELIENDPYNPDFMQLLANVYERQSRLDKAEEYFLQALSIKPYLATLQNELAQLYMKKEDYVRALRLAQEAHTLEPEKTFITETLALVYIKMQDYTAATALADSLFLDDPHSAGAHLIKMTVALNRGDYDSASQHYRAYLLYGQERSDYERIKEYYRGLAP